MGFLRWAAIIGTGGLAPVKGTSPRERTAKAAEKQVKLQKQALSATQPAPRSAGPTLHTALASVSAIAETTLADCSVARLRTAAIRTVSDLGYTPHDASIGSGAMITFRKPLTMKCRARDMGMMITPEATGTRVAVVAGPTTQMTDWGESRQIAEKLLSGLREVVAVTPEPPSEATAPQAVVESTASEIERLAQLHTQGALTDAEFAAAKAKILGS
jgi:hypothetical protein